MNENMTIVTICSLCGEKMASGEVNRKFTAGGKIFDVCEECANQNTFAELYDALELTGEIVENITL